MRRQVDNKFGGQNINPIRVLKEYNTYLDFDQTGRFESLFALYTDCAIENILKLINKDKKHYNKVS